MTQPLTRITAAARIGPSTLDVTWRDGLADRVDLAGWIATGGRLLAPLRDEAVFATVRLGEHGASVEWGPEGGDLAIDAHHLRLIADEQRPFGREEVTAWQAAAGLSSREAADFLGVSPGTWNAYKAGTNPIPAAVAMACRAALRDPILLQAHHRPSRPRRPRRFGEPSVA